MLVDIKTIDLKEVIKRLSEEFDVDDIIVKYWEDEESRYQGLSDLYMFESQDLEGIIYEAKKLIDRDCYACVEVISKDENGEEVLYFYDVETEQLLKLN